METLRPSARFACRRDNPTILLSRCHAILLPSRRSPVKASTRHLFLLGACIAALPGALWLRGAEPARSGTQTEKRFPPLKVPAGFKATLFACDPLIEYPAAISIGPRPGAIFAAVDYMTGLGTEIVRRDEIRLVEDTDGDGYADKATVFAKGFNSIQGLATTTGRCTLCTPRC